MKSFAIVKQFYVLEYLRSCLISGLIVDGGQICMGTLAINIISLVLSVLSFVVALFAVIYAKRQANQMRQANRIALYAGRMEIFNSFREVGRMLTGNGAEIPKPAVIDFYKHVEASKFVFSREPQVHGELEAFWRALDELVELQRRSDPASRQKALSVVNDCEIRKSRIHDLLESVLRKVGDV
jgi:hypothetical protein